MPEQLRLMAVHAHPDDESSKGAATAARYVAEGRSVLVVSCTGGERGDILNPALKDQAEILRDMPEVRRHEMAAAQQILGVEHTWLGFVDSGLPEGDPLPPLPEGCFALAPLEVTTEALVRVIRRYRPHVLTTYDERGGYPHPDHIMTHVVTMAAFQAAGDPRRFPDAGEPWQPLKVYYNQTHSAGRIRGIHQAIEAEGGESPYAEWIAKLDEWPSRTVTASVECADWFGVRDDALRAHATQVDPEGNWFKISRELERRVHPTEDYELALSLVPVDNPETDLFAGLEDVAEADALARRDWPRAGEELRAAYDGRTPEPEQERDSA